MVQLTEWRSIRALLLLDKDMDPHAYAAATTTFQAAFLSFDVVPPPPPPPPPPSPISLSLFSTIFVIYSCCFFFFFFFFQCQLILKFSFSIYGLKKIKEGGGGKSREKQSRQRTLPILQFVPLFQPLSSLLNECCPFFLSLFLYFIFPLKTMPITTTHIYTHTTTTWPLPQPNTKQYE